MASLPANCAWKAAVPEPKKPHLTLKKKNKLTNPTPSNPNPPPSRTPALTTRNHQSSNTLRITTTTTTEKLKHLIQSQSFDEAKDLYIKLKCRGRDPGIVLESVYINVLMKSGRVSDAFQVFDEMPDRNVVTWTSMISGCARNGLQGTGLLLLIKMLESGVVANDFAISAALGACADLSAIGLGEQLHSVVVRTGLESDCRTGNCLIDFYSRCGLMDKALLVFEGMLEKDLVSFTSLISGFCRNGMFEPAVRVFDQMVSRGLQPNDHTVTSILTACGLLLGEQIHGFMIKSRISRSVYSATALIEFYSEHNQIENAKQVFDKLEAKNIVSWSSMISCCLRNEHVEDAFRVFCEMVCAGVKPNEFTLAAAVGACGFSPEFTNLGQQLHCSAIKFNLVLDTRISNALITMYARNSKPEELGKVFEEMGDPDVVSWCSVITGYFKNGLEERSTALLCEMHRTGYTPNEYGFSSALGSCANLALLDQGRQFHCFALKLGCILDVCTGNSLVNMYAKCGHIDDASLAFEAMPIRDAMSWNSLIHGYAHHGKGKKALEVFEKMVESKDSVPDQSTFVGILVGCNHLGCMEEGVRYFKIMKDNYGVAPSSSHLACLIDMMGRAGRLREALDITNIMPFNADTSIWKSILASCRLHGNLKIGKLASEKIVELTPMDSASYVLLSNLHAMNGEWQDAERVRGVMEKRGVKKEAGWSWIETSSEVHAFVASDHSHPKAETIYRTLKNLFHVMKCEDYSLDNSFKVCS